MVSLGIHIVTPPVMEVHCQFIATAARKEISYGVLMETYAASQLQLEVFSLYPKGALANSVLLLWSYLADRY